MTTVTAVQAVAKKLEKMLETALNQLKVEQRLRKEGDNKLIDLELSLVNAEHALKSADEKYETLRQEKDDKIAVLKSRVQLLEESLQQKEQELLNSRDGLEELEEQPVSSLQETVDKFEDRLKNLLDTSGDISEEPEASVGISDEDYDDLVMDDEDTNEVIEMEEIVMKDETVEEFDPKNIIRCKVCENEFPNNKDLTDHQKETGHGYDLVCKICERKFKTKYTLKSHMDTVHSDNMPFKCKKCDQRFKDDGSCRRHQANNALHIRLDAEKQNPHLMCNICGKKFARKRRWCLDQHYLTHMDTKRFPCTYCGKDFLRPAYLEKHAAQCGVKQEEED